MLGRFNCSATVFLAAISVSQTQRWLIQLVLPASSECPLSPAKHLPGLQRPELQSSCLFFKHINHRVISPAGEQMFQCPVIACLKRLVVKLLHLGCLVSQPVASQPVISFSFPSYESTTLGIWSYCCLQMMTATVNTHLQLPVRDFR